MTRCIWCKGLDGPSALEHIMPEGLGCPEGFVLSGGTVCERCNNRLAHLDQAVIDEFDILAYMAGVPRKKGRPPAIRSRGNVIGTIGPSGKEISINLGAYPVRAHDGSKLGVFGKSARSIRATIERDGHLAKVSFSVSFGQNPKFIRGIVKIAFSSLAYFLGTDVALADNFDSIRLYVRNGQGSRAILLMPSRDDGYRNEAWPPYKSDSGEYAVTFRLAAVEFCVDLSPNLTLFPMLKDKAIEMYGESGWCCLPTNI